MKKKLLIVFTLFFITLAQAQNIMIINGIHDTAVAVKYETEKPKAFSFLTHVPNDLFQITKSPFQKKNLKNLIVITGVSTALIIADQAIYNAVKKFSGKIHFHSAEKNKTIWSVKTGKTETVLLKAPRNLNTGFYNLGQGFTTLIVAAGMYVNGKISKNNLSLQTASDLTESFISLGIVTQLLKYATGREDPGVASKKNGAWHPFPSWSAFQNKKTHYDAFPSGHLSTLMAAVTILANNYPHSRLIKPIGYTLAALTSLCMINNGVHWAGDYPLAIGLGYLAGNIITSRHNHTLKKEKPVL
ncbi:MAG: phosphatase PAP2 family protein [Ferruginibacter sp.]